MKDLSIFISLILRHKPEEIGIALDEYGWANIYELLEGIRKTGRKIDFELLKKIVETDSKQRYSFNEDMTKIRANQGYSISVDLELKETIPPKYLYHGTATRFIEKILVEGLKPMNRSYVHLSLDADTAVAVGKRHGKPAVLRVAAHEMHADGYKFYISRNGVWLTESVGSEYLYPHLVLEHSIEEFMSPIVLDEVH